MHAVHHEDTSGLGRHGTNHPPIEVEHVHRLDPQSLIGAGRAIAPEKETVGCDTIPRLAARPIDREVAGDPGQIGARVFDFREQFAIRSEEHTSELQSLMRISYAVFCLKKKQNPRVLTYMRNNVRHLGRGNTRKEHTDTTLTQSSTSIP